MDYCHAKPSCDTRLWSVQVTVTKTPSSSVINLYTAVFLNINYSPLYSIQLHDTEFQTSFLHAFHAGHCSICTLHVLFILVMAPLGAFMEGTGLGTSQGVYYTMSNKLKGDFAHIAENIQAIHGQLHQLACVTL